MRTTTLIFALALTGCASGGGSTGTTLGRSYGASLLLDGDTQTYYAASFQHKVFVRVFKNRSEENAEKHYRRLSGWTEMSAKDEIANMKKTVKTNRNVSLGEKSAGLDGG